MAVMAIPVFAQDAKTQFNPVYTGVTSLSIAPDARAGALGDVGVATEPDANSQYWNPAKYPFNIARAGVSMSYTPWLRQLVSDIDLVNLAGFYRIGDYSAVSSSLTYFSLGEVFVENEMTIKPYEMAFDVAYSRMLSETFSAAIALRYIFSDLQYDYTEDMSPGHAFAADIALYYNKYLFMGNRECLLGLGMNISNIGTKISYGVVASLAKDEYEGSPLNIDASAKDGAIAISFENTEFELLQLKLTGIDKKDDALYCCGYVAFDGSVSYINGDAIAQTALKISYNNYTGIPNEEQ